MNTDKQETKWTRKARRARISALAFDLAKIRGFRVPLNPCLIRVHPWLKNEF